MFLNNVSGRDPINGQFMVDPISHDTPLPAEVAFIILQKAKTNLHFIALVCKSWKVLADNEMFLKEIRPIQAFGTQEWEDYIGVDAGEEPHLPRRAYGDLENEDGLLTFIPEKVKAIKGNGVIEEFPLNTLKAIGKWVKNPKKGHKTGYEPDTLKESLQKKRKQEKPHWVWIKKEVFGRNERYPEQQKLAKEENKKISGANIAGLLDVIISLFMEYVRSGQRYFRLDADEYSLVKVHKKDGLSQICLGFGLDGMDVDNYYAPQSYSIGFALARKCFGYYKAALT